MTTRTKHPATYEDIEALPPGWVGEILADTFYGHPRPAIGHARAALILGHLLTGPFDEGVGGPGGWWFLFEPELHFDRDVIVPDIAAWRRERMPVRPAANEPYLTLAPDWVCEILSPSTQDVDRLKKLPRYHVAQVSNAWLIDPLQRSLEVFEHHERGWLLTSIARDNAEIRAAPFADVVLPLARLWTD